MMTNHYKIGEIVNNFEILGVNKEKKYTRYYCKCLKCKRTYLYQKVSISKNKGNGCQVCSHHIDTNDIVGKEFDSWKVIKKLKPSEPAYNQKYLCECKKCGKTFESYRYKITNKSHSYCQYCFRNHICEYKPKCNGRTKTRIYNLWQGIKSRCYYTRDIGFHNYGGRGIKVCEEWLGENGFENFKTWALNNGYEEEILPNGRNKWTIDRIDVNGNYEPSNCRFITLQEQSNNTRHNVYYNFEGKKLTLSQICRIKNLNHNTVENRINNHKWTIEEAIYTPIGQKRPSRIYKWDKKEFNYNGELLSKNDICEKFNLSRTLIHKRLSKGFSIKEVIEVPLGMPINRWREQQKQKK